MKKEDVIPLWTQETPSICRFCAYAKRFSATCDIYCEKKKNFLHEEESCKKFKYDILKKELRRNSRPVKKHTPEEFKI
ncbi:MAG: hypothetical protein IKZ35_06030 [Clostridia bacterium]|nr:hypothetical protein [Oscillospiraceae bacterium]MBR4893514.1 hypothetical protein [Clostridia bacterium]